MVLTSGKMVFMQVIASLMADEALGNVTGAFLESDTPQRENKNCSYEATKCQDFSLDNCWKLWCRCTV